MHFPHLNNTLLSFEYLEGGMVVVNSNLSTEVSKKRAQELMELVGLNKLPGHLKFNRNDTRWRHRRTAWEWAEKLLLEYQNQKHTPDSIAEFAVQRGFFSVWFSVFRIHPEVLKALIKAYSGTAKNCFDLTNPSQLLPRNLTNSQDPV